MLLCSVREQNFQNCFLVNRKMKTLHFFRLVLSQNNPSLRPFRTLLIKNWMNPEFENCLMQDLYIADMGINLLRIIHTVQYNADKLSIKCIRRNFLFVHFTTQLKT